MIRFIVAGAIVLIAATGCSFFRDDPVVALAKCIKASNYLEDAELRAAAERKQEQMRDPRMTPRENSLLGEKLRDEAQPQGPSTDPRYVVKVAEKWRASPACQEMKKEFTAYTETRVQALLNPALTVTDPRSCARLREQFVAAYRDTFARGYRPQLESALRTTLQDAGRGLKPFQAEYFQAQMEAGKLQQLAGELGVACEAGGPVAERARSMKSVAAQESPNSLALKKLDETPVARDCGDLPQVFCRSELWKQAVAEAYHASRSCDQDLVTQEECAGGPDAMVHRAFRRRQVDALAAERGKAARNLETPENVIGGLRDLVARDSAACTMKAERAGLRGAQYEEHVQSACIEPARAKYLRPLQDYLAMITARLQALDQDAPK